MKQIITSLTLVFAAFAVKAQPVVSPSALPAPGFSTNFYIGDSTGSGPVGANVTWDFHALTYQNAGSITLADPTLTPHSSKYSTANLSLEIDVQGFLLYNYYRGDATGLSKLGEGVSDAFPSEIDYLQDSKLWLKFPFNFNDQFVDAWKGATNNGSDTVLYDGYGTLITPFDTFANVIRTRTISVDASAVVDTTYTWFSTSPAIFQIMEMTDGESMILEDVPTATTSISKVTGKNNPLRIYPNPATTSVTIDAGKINGALAIYDVMGKLLQQATISGEPLVIGTGNFKPGIYFYKLAGTNGLEYNGSFTIN